MNKQRLNVWIILGLVVLFVSTTRAQNESVDPFLGMWALTLDYDHHHAGWLEVRQEKGYIDADLLWRSGSVRPIDFTFIMDGELFLTRGRDMVRKKDVDGNPLRTLHPIHWFQVRKTGRDMVEGVAVFPKTDGTDVEMVTFTGKRIPVNEGAPGLDKVKFGDPISLFNGKNLDGWELLDKQRANGWKAVDGMLINDPVQTPGEHKSYGNLRTTQTFEDFNLKLEVNVPAKSNSGIYLRGIYEVQVSDSYGQDLDSHNMGALYSRIKPLVSAEKPAGEWQQMDITLYKRHLTVKLNGKLIIDNQPVKGVTGGAMTSDEFKPGPIYLQGDHGKVRYRNIVLKPILI